MKSRQIQSRLWDDEFIVDSTWQSRYVFIYLCTCSAMNMSGLFQLHDKKIIFETGLSEENFNIAKEELSANKKVIFCKGWVYVVNAFKNFMVWKSPTNWDAWQQEWNKVSDDVLASIDTSMGTSIYTSQKQEIENIKLVTGKKRKYMSKHETDEMLEDINL